MQAHDQGRLTHLTTVVDSLDDAFVGEDLNGVITGWNKGAERVFGYAAREIVGSSISRLIPADRSGEEKQLLERVRHGEIVRQFETVRQTKGGRLIDVSLTLCPVLDAAGRMTGLSKITRDITEQKRQAREILRLSHLYLALSRVNQVIIQTRTEAELFPKVCRALVEAGGFRMAWIGWLNPQSQRVEPAAQYGDATGYLSRVMIYAGDLREGQGPTGTAIIAGRHYICNDFFQDPCTAPWREAAQQAGFLSSAALPLRRGGIVCGALTVYSGAVGFFQQKEIALLEEAANDLSFAVENLERDQARQRAEEEARWKTAFLEAQVNSTDDGVLVVDSEGRKILQNERMVELWKIPPQIALRKDNSAQLHFLAGRAKNPAPFTDRAAYLYAHPEETSRDVIELTDGTILDRYSAPVRGQDGKYYGRIWTFRDITEQRRLESQLRQRQKMEAIGQLAGGVAHDFNNILTVIQMQSDLLKRLAGTSSDQAAFADEISASVARATSLTRQLLLFSRQQVFKPDELPLNVAVSNTAKMLKRILPENVRVNLRLGPEPTPINGDEGMIGQVLMNLAVNARDAMPKGGQLTIETSVVELDKLAATQSPQFRPGSFARLTVRDTGCGIPAEILPRIFEPFFTTKAVGKGTGLGLATVVSIVQQHQGWVDVYSHVGQGTTFHVYFPRRTPAADGAEPATPPLTTVRGGNETILLVEDDAGVREAVGMILTQLGYHLLVASDGAGALKLWKENQGAIRLLLTDIIMTERMTGKDLVQRIAAASKGHPSLRIIYMSGHPEELLGDDFPLRENAAFLNKPFETLKLARIVRESLDTGTGA